MMRALINRLIAVLRDSIRIWWLAPWIPLIAVLPEFAQHVAEVNLGMFESREAGIALSNDPTRWTFGYVKVAGLMVAMLLIIRFWGAREQDIAWWSPYGIAWKVLGLAFLANAVATGVIAGIEHLLIGADEAIATVVTAAQTIATLPLLVWLVAGLVGDRDATLASIYRSGWWASLRIAAFGAIVFVPLEYLHGLNHDWAFGAGQVLLWTLMVFDSLVVGLISVGLGTAIHHGYRRLDSAVGQR